MKSRGRAPTFLAMTGYEQVRSVAAAPAGDLEAAGAGPGCRAVRVRVRVLRAAGMRPAAGRKLYGRTGAR